VLPKQGKRRLAPLVVALLLSVTVALTVGVGAAVAQTEETTTTVAPTTTTTESTTTTTAPCGYSEATPCIVALGSWDATVLLYSMGGVLAGGGLAVLILWTMRFVKGVESK
jgi:hypothetical protein